MQHSTMMIGFWSNFYPQSPMKSALIIVLWKKKKSSQMYSDIGCIHTAASFMYWVHKLSSTPAASIWCCL